LFCLGDVDADAVAAVVDFVGSPGTTSGRFFVDEDAGAEGASVDLL
jgi:hypothetical protein